MRFAPGKLFNHGLVFHPIIGFSMQQSHFFSQAWIKIASMLNFLHGRPWRSAQKTVAHTHHNQKQAQSPIQMHGCQSAALMHGMRQSVPKQLKHQ